jgi:hypothetical protein
MNSSNKVFIIIIAPLLLIGMSIGMSVERPTHTHAEAPDSQTYSNEVLLFPLQFETLQLPLRQGTTVTYSLESQADGFVEVLFLDEERIEVFAALGRSLNGTYEIPFKSLWTIAVLNPNFGSIIRVSYSFVVTDP